MTKYNITSAAAGQNPGSAIKGYLQDEEDIQYDTIDPQPTTPSNPQAPKRGVPIERFGIEGDAKTTEDHGVEYDEDTFNLVAKLADDLQKNQNPETALTERFSEPSDVSAVEFLNPTTDYDTRTDEGFDPLTLAERNIISDTSIEQESKAKLKQLNEDLKKEIVDIGTPDFNTLTSIIDNTLYSANKRDPQLNPRYKYGTDPQILTAMNKLGAYDPVAEKVRPEYSSALSFAIIDQLVTKRVEAEEKLQKARKELDDNIKGLSYDKLTEAQFELADKTARANELALNTQEDANKILRTAEKVLSDGRAPIAQGQSVVDTLTPQEQSALVDSVYRTLEEREFLAPGLKDSKGRTITWLMGGKIGQVMKNIPDVINRLQGDNTKEPSNSPNPGGRSATDAGLKYKPTGKTTAKIGLRWLAKVEKALDYFGTTPMWISTPTLNAEMNLLQDILSYSPNPALAPTTIDGTAINNTLFNNKDPNKRLSIAISNHDAASYFKMDINSLRSAFNSSRPIPPVDPNTDKPLYTRVPFIKTEAKLLDAIQKWNNGLDTNPDADTWITSAVEKFNQGVSDYTNPLFEANGRKGDSFFFHQELIGVNGRMRIADTTINPQTSPAFRGLITPNKILIVDPESSGERTKNFKAMVARNLNLTMRVVGKDGKYVTKTKGGIVATAEVKAEHLPRLEQRTELFDLYFGPLKDKDKNDSYIKDKKKEGAQLVSAANAMSGIGTERSINNAIDDNVSDQLNKDFKDTKSIDNSRNAKFSDRWANALGLKASKFNKALPQPKRGIVKGPDISSVSTRENIAVALNAKSKRDSDGNPGKIQNDHKEGSIRMNTLMNLARFKMDHPFRSDIVTELDGINNNFAILALLLGDTDLAVNSGLINPNLEETGQIVSDGDMRDFVQREAQRMFDEISEEYTSNDKNKVKDSEMFSTTAQAVLNAIDTVGKGTTKLAWKDIIMQAGYGKDFGSFPAMFYDKLSNDSDFIDGLQEQLGNITDGVEKDPYTALHQTSQLVPIILGKALGTLKNYTDLTKRTGTLASILKQEYVTVASSGFPSSMLKRSVAPKIRGSVDDNVVRADLTHDRLGVGKRGLSLEKQFELDPFQIKGGISASESQGRTTLDDLLAKDYDDYRYDGQTNTYKPDTPEAFWDFLKNSAFSQRNRAPVLPIHAEDASVMVAVANYAANKNVGKSAKEKIWFYQIFDALMVDVDSYTDIPREYNRALVHQVATLDRYGQDLLELAKFKRNAVKDGDIEVAKILSKLTSESSTGGITDRLDNLQRRIDKTRQEIHKELDEINKLGSDNNRYKDYEAFVKRRESLLKRLENLHLEPRYKVPENVMENLFKGFGPYHKQVKDLKEARKTVKHKTEDLYKQLISQAKKMNSDVDYDISNLGLGTHNAS